MGPHRLPSWSKDIGHSENRVSAFSHQFKKRSSLARTRGCGSSASLLGGEGVFRNITQLCGYFLPAMDHSDYHRTNLTGSGVCCAEHIYLSKVKLRR